jgi:hypothetical protein
MMIRQMQRMSVEENDFTAHPAIPADLRIRPFERPQFTLSKPPEADQMWHFRLGL